jgi:hypothetical protein
MSQPAPGKGRKIHVVLAEDLAGRLILIHLDEKAFVANKQLQWIEDLWQVQCFSRQERIRRRGTPEVEKFVTQLILAETAVQ